MIKSCVWIGLVVNMCTSCSGGLVAAPRTTTLSDSNIAFTVPEKPYAVLRRGPVEAVIVDNRAVDDEVLPGHRAGYHGIASLKHRQQGRNLFVPSYSGLNFEHIHDGTNQERAILFEPRQAPMQLRVINDWTAELYQPPTPHWGLESALRYELLEDGTIELTFECIPRRLGFRNGYIGLFWASYIDQPESGDVHFLGTTTRGVDERAEWIRSASPRHGELATHRPRTDLREYAHDDPFELTLPFGFSDHRYSEPWFYGECRGMLFAQVFRAADQVRLSQSPSGGGTNCPAWDFQWFIDQPEIGRCYQLVMRAVYAPLLDTAAVAAHIRAAGTIQTAVSSSAQPELGLAARYVGDEGIERDPAVLFSDNFESGELRKWDETRGSMIITAHLPHQGKQCAHAPMERGKNTGGDAIKWFMPAADKVYARCYVKFSADYQYNHHFLTLLANQQQNKWSAFGKAGLKPNGTYFSTGMEPAFAWGKNPAPGEVNMYSYFLDMEPDPKMNKYWGNAFYPPGPGRGLAAGGKRVIPPLDKWHCWEFMIQANSGPEKSDGKQAMWIDGELVGDFTGIHWRNDPELKVNCFWLQHYGYDESDPTRQYSRESQSVWFDDVVVAREYIGPLNQGLTTSPK